MPDLVTELIVLEGRIAKLQNDIRQLQQGNTEDKIWASRSEEIGAVLLQRLIEWSGLLRHTMNARKDLK